MKIHREPWYREASPNFLEFVRGKLLEMVKAGLSNRKVSFAVVLWAAAVLASVVGLSFVMKKSAADGPGKYKDTRLGLAYEFTLCILWGFQTPGMERCWRGYCHYQDTDGPQESYSWHFKGNMKQAWDILRGRAKWGPDPDSLTFVEVEPGEGES